MDLLRYCNVYEYNYWYSEKILGKWHEYKTKLAVFADIDTDICVTADEYANTAILTWLWQIIR